MISLSLAGEDIVAAGRTTANQADWDHCYSGLLMWSVFRTATSSARSRASNPAARWTSVLAKGRRNAARRSRLGGHGDRQLAACSRLNRDDRGRAGAKLLRPVRQEFSSDLDFQLRPIQAEPQFDHLPANERRPAGRHMSANRANQNSCGRRPISRWCVGRAPMRDPVAFIEGSPLPFPEAPPG